MEPIEFSSARGDRDQAAFQHWQSANPGGFYINRKTASAGMLRRVGCRHVGKPHEWDAVWGDVVRRAKVCHTDRKVLLKWAANWNVEVSECADCRP